MDNRIMTEELNNSATGDKNWKEMREKLNLYEAKIAEYEGKERHVVFKQAGLDTTKGVGKAVEMMYCLLYTSPSPRDLSTSRMPSSA